MKGSIAMGIKDGLQREVPDSKEYAYREVNREIREQLIKEMTENTVIIPEDITVSVNTFIEDHIKEGSRTNNFKKSFTIVDAIVDGKKRVVTFASKSLAIKVMQYIRDTYEDVELTYEITQM
jgi:hypothetical protein